jgi:hypothetical protein
MDWRLLIQPPKCCRECEHCRYPERVCAKHGIKIRDTDKKECEDGGSSKTVCTGSRKAESDS